MKNKFPREEALKVADEIVDVIKPYCDRIEIAGSIRRKKLEVHDIDIVALPKDCDEKPAVKALLDSGLKAERKGSKLVSGEFKGVPVDLYFANQENFGVLLLIRTGSREHNIKLCRRAIELGMKLSAAKGVIKDGAVIASRTEEEIFDALKMDYVRPEDRN